MGEDKWISNVNVNSIGLVPARGTMQMLHSGKPTYEHVIIEQYDCGVMSSSGKDV